MTCSGGAGRRDDPPAGRREITRQPGHGGLNVFVTDVDALYQELNSRGARTLNEPKDYLYVMRDFDVHDLEDNQLCFGMESAKPAG